MYAHARSAMAYVVRHFALHVVVVAQLLLLLECSCYTHSSLPMKV
jgi:hypothetical protein